MRVWGCGYVRTHTFYYYYYLFYYYHAKSGTSTWEVPKADAAASAAPSDSFEDAREPEQSTLGAGASNRTLPDGWTEHVDPDSSITYFFHAGSGKSTWEFPVS